MNLLKRFIIAAITFAILTFSCYEKSLAASTGVIALSAASYTVSEDARTVTIRATRTGGNTGAFLVNYVISNGTATMYSDYQLTLGMLSTSNMVVGNNNSVSGDNNAMSEASGWLYWADGDTTDKTIVIEIINDTLSEENETFSVSLNPNDSTVLYVNGQEPGAGPFFGTPLSATVTIADDDPLPVVQFSTASSSGSEATSPVVVNVVLSAVSGKTVTVNYATANGTATAESDYTETSGTLIFNPGETNKTINVPVINDSIIETNETFMVNLTNPVNTSLGPIGTHTHTINNDDYYGSFQLSASSYSVSESAGEILITATRTGGSSGSVSFAYNISSGTATLSEDFTVFQPQQNNLIPNMASNGSSVAGSNNTLSGWLSWADGDAADKTIRIAVINDTLNEENEIFTVSISLDFAQISVVQGQDMTAHPILGIPSSATVTIADDDPLPTVQFSSAASNGNETTTPGVFNVTLSAASGKTIDVNYATANGTAIAGTDYTTTVGTLTFNPGETEKTITVPIINDVVIEPDETFTIALSGPVNTTLGVVTTHTYTIISDDNNGVISFGVSGYTVSEKSAAVTITATRTGSSNGAVGVTYTTSDGTATAGSDYTAKTGTLSWASGDMTNKTFTITIKNDNSYEDNETFFVTLSNPIGGAVLGSIPSATVTITDNDNPPMVQFFSASSSGSESLSPAPIRVTLSAASGRAITISYETVDGTATAGSDYTAISASLVFNPGETSKAINIPIINDADYERNETFTVKLSNPVNARLGARTVHTRTITDDDRMPSVQFQTAHSNGPEGVSPARITVVLSAASYQTVKVLYSTRDSSATSGSDYTSTWGILTFSPGTTSQIISVPIMNDTTTEGSETFMIRLLSPTNAVLGPITTHAFTIIENYPLTIFKAGSGDGNVVSNVGNVTWNGAEWAGTFTAGSNVILTAVPNPDSTFTGWSGCTSVSGNICTIAMDSPKSATVAYSLNLYTITTPAVAGGNVACVPNPVPHGSSTTCGITMTGGYTLIGLTDNEANVVGSISNGTYTIPNVTGPHTVTTAFQSWTWQIPFAISENNVATPYQLGASSTDIAATTGGTVLAVWNQYDGLQFRIVAAEYSPASGWGLPIFLSNRQDNAYGPRIKSDSAGNAIVVWYTDHYDLGVTHYSSTSGWQDEYYLPYNTLGFDLTVMPDDSYFIAMSLLNGQYFNSHVLRYSPESGWGTPEMLQTDSNLNSFNVRVAAGGSGDCFAVWEQYDRDITASGATKYIWASRYHGITGWGPAQRIENQSLGHASSPAVGVDSEGNATVVWQQLNGPGGLPATTRTNIWFNRYSVGTGWGAEQLLSSNNSGNAYMPSLASNANGDTMVVWRQSTAWRYGVVNLWFRSFRGDVGWGTPSKVSSDISWGSDESYQGRITTTPVLQINQAGNLLVLWDFDNPNIQQNIASSIYINGIGWTPAQLIDSPSAGYGYSPKAVFDGNGNGIAIWNNAYGFVDQPEISVWTNRLK